MDTTEKLDAGEELAAIEGLVWTEMFTGTDGLTMRECPCAEFARDEFVGTMEHIRLELVGNAERATAAYRSKLALVTELFATESRIAAEDIVE